MERLVFGTAGALCVAIAVLIMNAIVPYLGDKEALASITMTIMILVCVCAIAVGFIFGGLAFLLHYQKWCMRRYLHMKFSRRRLSKV